MVNYPNSKIMVLKETQIKKEYESNQYMEASSTLLPVQCVGKKETGKHLLTHFSRTRVVHAYCIYHNNTVYRAWCT